jgi:uncharacterized membrane-anchored protein
MQESLIKVLSLLEVLDEDNVPRRVKIKIHKVVDGISVFKISFFVHNLVAVQVVYSVIPLGQISVVVRHFFLKIPIFVVYNPIVVLVVYSVTTIIQISAVVWRFFLKISVVVVVRKSLAEI